MAEPALAPLSGAVPPSIAPAVAVVGELVERPASPQSSRPPDPPEEEPAAEGPPAPENQPSRLAGSTPPAASAVSEPSQPEPAPAAPPTSTAGPAQEIDLLALIRSEIRQRLPYFQGCAIAARRRNGVEVQRLQATWAIASDGTIERLKLEGVADAQLATCIVRVGSRPFTVQPGVELVVPTPIVFVR